MLDSTVLLSRSSYDLHPLPRKMWSCIWGVLDEQEKVLGAISSMLILYVDGTFYAAFIEQRFSSDSDEIYVIIRDVAGILYK